MKYMIPEAKLVELELNSIVLASGAIGGGEGGEGGDCGEDYEWELILQDCANRGEDIA